MTARNYTLQGRIKRIKRPSISRGERMHSNSRTHPASDATRREMRGKQDALSKGLSRKSYDRMDDRRGKVFQNGDWRKARISRRLEDQPKSGSIGM
jgi:hypothetical protein